MIETTPITTDNEEELVGNVELTLEEIMCLSEEDLQEMGMTREELIEIASLSKLNEDVDEQGILSPINEQDCDSSDIGENDEEEYKSEEEIEIDVQVDETLMQELEMEECVETNIEDLPFLNEIYLENMMNWSWDEHLDPRPIEIKTSDTSTIKPKAGLSKKNRLKRALLDKTKPTVQEPGTLFLHPKLFWENYEQIIKNRFKNSYNVTHIECIVNEKLIQRFKDAISEQEKIIGKNVSNRIFLSFHGTHPYNIPNIKEQGLLVPGKNNNNVSVMNGSAYGVGIYLSVTDPSLSVGYCCGGNQLFACAVLLSDRVNTKNHGNILVIMEEKFVLPCFLVTVQNKNQPTASIPTLKEEEKKEYKTKKGELVFSKKRKEEQREKNRLKKKEKELLVK